MNAQDTSDGGPLSFADTLSPLERAKHRLPTDLSLLEVATLTFPGDYKFQQFLVQTLISNAKAGTLPVYGDPAGWWIHVAWEKCGGGVCLPQGKSGYADNPYPRADGHIVKGLGPYPGDYDPWRWGVAPPRGYHGACCLVSRADYFAFLKTPYVPGIPVPEWPAPIAETLPEPIPPVETPLPESVGGAAEKTAARPAKLRPDQQDKLDCQEIARALWAEHPDWRQVDLLKHPKILPYWNKWTGKNTVPGWLSEVDPHPKSQRGGRPKNPR